MTLHHLSHSLKERSVAGIFDHEGGQLAVEPPEEDYVARSHLIEHGYHFPLAKGALIGGLHGGEVGNIAVVTYDIVVDVVPDILYQAVVSHLYVPERGIVDARVLVESLAHLYLSVEGSYGDISVEHNPMHIVRVKPFSYSHTCPVLCLTSVFLQDVYFIPGQKSVVVHVSSPIGYRKSL